MSGTEQRLEREQQFHDDWAAKIDAGALDVRVFWEGSTCPENRFILRHIRPLAKKRVLELGCGAGENSVYLALQGAECVATDVSPGMLETTRSLAKRYNTQVECALADAMQIPYEADGFDIVYAANMLHHVDPERALREMHRVTRPGGNVCFWDPLRHNPLINVYRRLARDVRTLDERPLSFGILKHVRALFSGVEYDTFWLASLWIFIRFFLIERIDPNAERYWKKIIREEERLRASYGRLEKLDVALKRIACLRPLAWNLAVVATK